MRQPRRGGKNSGNADGGIKASTFALFLGRLPCSRNFFFFFCQSGQVMIPQIGVIFSGIHVFLGVSCHRVVDRKALLEAEKCELVFCGDSEAWWWSRNIGYAYEN